MRRTPRLVLLVLLSVAAVLPAGAAPLFPDLPENHWALDAVRALAARGLVEGYPDGTFKGDRSANRYEVAMVVARLLARMEQEHATFATKAELQEVRKLAEAYREELAAFGVRVTRLEEDTARLDQRVRELERIRFYGRVHTIAVSNNTYGSLDNVGTAAVPGIDWSSGRLLVEGTGLTNLGLLGFNADLDEDWLAGGEFVAYTTYGDLPVDQYWGISPPWLVNPWTARGSPAPGAQPDNNQPFTRTTLDNFWVRHRPTDTRATFGSYFQRYFATYIFNGARNPNYHRPRWLPLFGADVHGTIGGKESGVHYEAFYSIDPDRSVYHTHTFGATLRYEFPDEKGSVSVHGARTLNERINEGARQITGAIALPAVPFTGPGAPPVAPGAWIDARRGVSRFFVGPQAENTLGVDVDYEIYEPARVRLFGEYAHSWYRPDTSGTLFGALIRGDMGRFGVRAEPVERLHLGLEYLQVDPDYDPFIIAYPTPPGTPVFLPYGTYYSAFYQLHDYLSYPNNREGFRFHGDYTLEGEKTAFYASYGNLRQHVPTTPQQVQKVGNIEPLFPMLQAGGGQKGATENVGVGVSHLFDVGLRADFSYYRYTLRRAAPRIDDVDLVQDVFDLNLRYPVTEEVTLRGGFWAMDYRGHSGILNTSFAQRIPSIGVDYQLSRDVRISLDYRFFDFDQRAFADADYNGTQLLFEMKVDF